MHPERAVLRAGSCFKEVPPPTGHDWLASHEESGQSFDAFIRREGQVAPRGTRTTMHLVCIGEFREDDRPLLEAVRSFAQAFFGCRVEMLPSIGAEAVSQRKRDRGGGVVQLHTHEIRQHLLALPKPASSFCVMGVTMADLYTTHNGIDCNFVYGQAGLSDGTGITSFARYRPTGYSQRGGLDSAGRALLLKRSCKLLAHEMGHILGLRHCIYYHCLMNGMHHLGEFDALPMFLCPVCLRKFLHATNCDALQHYHALGKWHAAHGLRGESTWISRRLDEITQCEHEINVEHRN